MERLWEIIRREQIEVVYCNLRKGRKSLYGIYCYDPVVGPVIMLDSSLRDSRRLHKCVLAEEIGHFYTVSNNNYLMAYGSYTRQIEMSRSERRALQYATDLLIPDAELCKALEAGCRSCYELAEYFDVTEWMVHRKLGFLKMCFRKTGLKVRGRDLFGMTTEPCCID